MYNPVSKILLSSFKEWVNFRFFLLEPTGISAANIGGTAIHSALEIKPEAKLSGFSDKANASLRNELSEVKLLMIDEISLVSGDLWTDIDARLTKIFSTSIGLPFAGRSLLVIADYLQLPPVWGRLIFSRFTSGSKMNQLLSLQLWHLLKYAELTEVVRQSDQIFVNVLNNTRLGAAHENTAKLLKARFIDQSEKNYPHDALHTYAEHEPTVLRNRTVINNLPGEVYSIEANDEIPNDCRYPFSMIQAAQNQKQEA